MVGETREGLWALWNGRKKGSKKSCVVENFTDLLPNDMVDVQVHVLCVIGKRTDDR